MEFHKIRLKGGTWATEEAVTCSCYILKVSDTVHVPRRTHQDCVTVR